MVAIYLVTATIAGIEKLTEQKLFTLNEDQKLTVEQTLRDAADRILESNNSNFINVV